MAAVLHPVAQPCYGGRVGTTISQRELRNDSGAIMRRVEHGERFTVTRNGIPVAELVPHDPTASLQRPQFVPVEEIATGLSGLPDWDVKRFKRETRLLEKFVDDRDRDRWSAP